MSDLDKIDFNCSKNRKSVNHLEFRLEPVRRGFGSFWLAQLNNDPARTSPDILEAIHLTGITFGDRKIACLIAAKFGYNIE